MIQWLTLDRLEQLTEQFHQAHAVYFDLTVDTAVSLDELQAVIPVTPVSNPHPSEPGPHECWYGCVDDFPFVITYYHHHSCDCYTTIRIFPSPPSQNRYLWSTLERLMPLAKPLLQQDCLARLPDSCEEPCQVTLLPRRPNVGKPTLRSLPSSNR